MIVASHQPHFNPYLGYMAKLHVADVFVISDDVQFTKSGFIHRNRVRSWQRPERWRWLTMPVRYRSDSAINEVELAHDEGDRLLNILQFEYHRASYYERVMTYLQPLMKKTESVHHLYLFNMLSLGIFSYGMGFLPNHTRLASCLRYDAEPGDKNGRLIALTRAVGGDTYLAGAEAARAYLDPQRFTDAGIKLLGIEYLNPSYPQVHDGEFLPKMGVIDALMNVGADAHELIGYDSYKITRLN